MEVRNEDGKILSTHESLSKLFSTVRTILILNDHSLLRRTADLFFLCFLHIFSIHPYFLHLENFQVCLGQLRTMSRIFIIWLTTFTSILKHLSIQMKHWISSITEKCRKCKNKTQFSSSFLQTTCKILSIKILIEYRVSVRQVSPKLLVHSTL